MTRNMTRFILLFALGLFLSSSATGQPQKTTDVARSDADFSGRVVDQEGKPVARARIDVNGVEVYSNDAGAFGLVARASTQYILNISHPDYADVSVVMRTPAKGQRWLLVRAQTETVDARNPITITDRRAVLERKRMGGATFSPSR